MNILHRLWYALMYLGNPPWDTGISPPELLRFIASHPPGRALDLGCGTGTNAITLAQHGWQVTGIDFSGKAIRCARRKAIQAGVAINFIRRDVSRLQGVGAPFDLVLDIGCFHSLPYRNRERYAAHLVQSLAPGGTYLLYAWMDEEGKFGMGLGRREMDLLCRETRDAESPASKRCLRLVERQDGTERGSRPSAWLTFQYTAKEVIEART